MECCKKNRETKFCPNCGRSLDQEPIYQLLTHVTKIALSFQKQSVSKEWGEFHRVKATKNYKKWDSWEKALRKLIKKMKEVEAQK